MNGRLAECKDNGQWANRRPSKWIAHSSHKLNEYFFYWTWYMSENTTQTVIRIHTHTPERSRKNKYNWKKWIESCNVNKSGRQMNKTGHNFLFHLFVGDLLYHFMIFMAFFARTLAILLLVWSFCVLVALIIFFTTFKLELICRFDAEMWCAISVSHSSRFDLHTIFG